MRAKATHFAVYVLVRGGGVAGLLDMMRYDSAHPATETESSRIESRMHGSGRGDWIILRRFVPVGGRPVPTLERWRSFGWECDWRTFSDLGEAEETRRALEKVDGMIRRAGEP